MSLLLFTNSFGERILGQKTRAIGQKRVWTSLAFWVDLYAPQKYMLES